MTITIILAWPSHKLSPNKRGNWRSKASAVKQARMDAGWCALAQAPDARLPTDAPLSVALVFCPPTARKFDTDGLISRCKPALDGIADALKFNDRQIRTLSGTRGEQTPGGRVEIYIDVEAR